MNRYCLILFSLCSVIAWASVPNNFEAIKKAFHDACSMISKVDQATIEKMGSGTFDDTDPAVREHVFCYAKKVEFINNNDELDEMVIKRKMSLQVTDEATVDKVMKICNSPKDGDKNLWACKIVACYYKNAPGVNIL